MCFNALWTSWPVFTIAVDCDVEPHIANANPYLYMSGPTRSFFNGYVFSSWVALAIFHGCVCQLLPVLTTAVGPVNEDGTIMGLWWSSLVYSILTNGNLHTFPYAVIDFISEPVVVQF